MKWSWKGVEVDGYVVQEDTPLHQSNWQVYGHNHLKHPTESLHREKIHKPFFEKDHSYKTTKVALFVEGKIVLSYRLVQLHIFNKCGLCNHFCKLHSNHGCSTRDQLAQDQFLPEQLLPDQLFTSAAVHVVNSYEINVCANSKHAVSYRSLLLIIT